MVVFSALWTRHCLCAECSYGWLGFGWQSVVFALLKSFLCFLLFVCCWHFQLPISRAGWAGKAVGVDGEAAGDDAGYSATKKQASCVLQTHCLVNQTATTVVVCVSGEMIDNEGIFFLLRHKKRKWNIVNWTTWSHLSLCEISVVETVYLAFSLLDLTRQFYPSRCVGWLECSAAKSGWKVRPEEGVVGRNKIKPRH